MPPDENRNDQRPRHLDDQAHELRWLAAPGRRSGESRCRAADGHRHARRGHRPARSSFPATAARPAKWSVTNSAPRAGACSASSIRKGRSRYENRNGHRPRNALGPHEGNTPASGCCSLFPGGGRPSRARKNLIRRSSSTINLAPTSARRSPSAKAAKPPAPSPTRHPWTPTAPRWWMKFFTRNNS